jgi:5-methylcytosine-specific restriction endonuclease McrA
VLPVTWPRLKPLSAERFAIQFTIDQSTREKLRYAQELLSHQLPSGDVAQVFDRALDALVAQLEKQKFAATEKPRTPSSRPRTDPRHIPPDVKRAVWARDGGQCTFVSDTGHRCGARKFLEFDHEIPVARGGQATIGGMRLRCRAHNQYEAERVFGTGFMNEKRRVSTEGRPAMKARAATGT